MRDDMATTPIVVDCETAGLDDVGRYLKPVTPDGRLTDPIKIAADIRHKEEARLKRLSLDPNVGRIVALGWWTAETGFTARACRTELEEIVAIANFWDAMRHRTIVGFNVKGFDLRFLVQRSRYLALDHPVLEFSPYSRRGVIDLFLDLTFNDGHRDQSGVMCHTLTAFCRRFGIPCDDTVTGADIPALVAAGKWDEVVSHCLADVQLTVLLAQRLGIVTATQLAEVI